MLCAVNTPDAPWEQITEGRASHILATVLQCSLCVYKWTVFRNKQKISNVNKGIMLVK